MATQPAHRAALGASHCTRSGPVSACGTSAPSAPTRAMGGAQNLGRGRSWLPPGHSAPSGQRWHDPASPQAQAEAVFFLMDGSMAWTPCKRPRWQIRHMCSCTESTTGHAQHPRLSTTGAPWCPDKMVGTRHLKPRHQMQPVAGHFETDRRV